MNEAQLLRKNVVSILRPAWEKNLRIANGKEKMIVSEAGSYFKTRPPTPPEFMLGSIFYSRDEL